jgi:hypothetical protein
MRKWSIIFALAWTMWIRTQSPTSETWSASTGLPTPEKCAASIKEKLETWRQFKDAKFGVNSVTFTDNDTTMSYYCLPDTEDPRKTPPKPVKPQK